MRISVPELSLVVLIGGSGKSSFAGKHFKPAEILSLDKCRAAVSNDEACQAATEDALELLHFIASKRLKNGLLTVIDASNVQAEARRPHIQLAKKFHCLPVAIVLNLPEPLCREKNKNRSDRQFGAYMTQQQAQQLRSGISRLKKEGFRHIYILNSQEEADAVETIVRTPLDSNKKQETGPFDIIGDVHGCFDELVMLLEKLGYRVERDDGEISTVTPPAHRKAVFLGDLVDRGPKTPEVLKLVMHMVNTGAAFCVSGNHDMKLYRCLQGRQVQLTHGLAESMQQLSREPPEFVEKVKSFLYGLTSHCIFDGGRLVAAHAGLREEMQGRDSGAVRSFCMYGETTGETDEFGLPVRYNWAMEYRGKAMVVYGHTPVAAPQWLNRTINIDTGCVFGGKLTALRYPEKNLTAVDALQTYVTPVRPIDYEPSALICQQQHDELLDIDDVTGKHIILTKSGRNIIIREENAAAALDVIGRFAVNPKWLIHIPPAMVPAETSVLPNYLEYPSDALKYYANHGLSKAVCEEKHRGSRVIVIVCKDEAAAARRFGIENEGTGICYTRTGRNFFSDTALETAFLDSVRDALTEAVFWETFATNWVCLDCELMPWSAKSESLLKGQAVGAASGVATADALKALYKADERGIEGVSTLIEKYADRKLCSERYVKAYRQYCRPSPDDYKLAPFHILATEGKAHTDKSHVWHLENIEKICKSDLFTLTASRVADLADERSTAEAIQWWHALTENGGEGMVVKPYAYLGKGKKGEILQPAIKCRGREYLRIIYGPEYTAPENMKRVKARGLSGKQSLASREFALGIEGLERFVNKEPLRRVHECAFGVLALESEQVDPRL